MPPQGAEAPVEQGTQGEKVAVSQNDQIIKDALKRVVGEERYNEIVSDPTPSGLGLRVKETASPC